MARAEPYAPPRLVEDLRDCLFYHTVDLPGFGTIEGLFDLRPGVDEYLGGVELRGKRVLELGTADGFLCFHMERQGARVVAYDLSEGHPWDFVPFAGEDASRLVTEYRENTRKLNNAFWLAHRLHRSTAQLVYGTVYEVPEDIGPVDVATFSCVLLHVRDPFLALQRALALTTEQVVVTELMTGWMKQLCKLWSPRVVSHAMPWWPRLMRPLSGLSSPNPLFLPDGRRRDPTPTWWGLGPRVVRRFLHILGFEQTQLTFHFQLYERHPVPMYTIVARRTAARAVP